MLVLDCDLEEEREHNIVHSHQGAWTDGSQLQSANEKNNGKKRFVSHHGTQPTRSTDFFQLGLFTPGSEGPVPRRQQGPVK